MPYESYTYGEEEHALLLLKTFFPGSEPIYEVKPAIEHIKNPHTEENIHKATANVGRKNHLEWI